jgi:imidazolonepropionase-like amidohydrolase
MEVCDPAGAGFCFAQRSTAVEVCDATMLKRIPAAGFIIKAVCAALLLLFTKEAFAQDQVLPAAKQTERITLTNATLHIGNGQVLRNSAISFENGLIVAVGSNAGGGKIIDVQGRHVYPGLIASDCTVGLTEIEAVRASRDFAEIGEMNPSVRSIIAYSADSKIINTLRSNGVLLAHVAPQGGMLCGSSSVVQFDAWNWEDAAYRMDNGMYFDMPNLVQPPNPFAAFLAQTGQQQGNPTQQAMEQLERAKAFFREAKAYAQESNHTAVNLKYEAVKKLFTKQQKLYVRCSYSKQIIAAVDMAREFGFDMVIVGGEDSWMVADLLKQYNIGVILSNPHELPVMQDDDVDQPYRTPSILQQAGVTFALSINGGWQQRNIPFVAGTAAAYGLGKEEALQSITLNAAKLLGIDAVAGSLEAGKHANIIVSEGDVLDMQSSKITHAYIQGRAIDLNDKQKVLFERYKAKYGIK